MTEIKDIILQLLLVLLPIVFIYTFSGTGNSSRWHRNMITAACIFSMFLCALFTIPVYADQHVDLRFIPLILGLLYGGRRNSMLIIACNIVVQMMFIGFNAGLIPTIIFILLYYAIAYRFLIPFERGSTAERLRIGFLLTTIAAIISLLVSIIKLRGYWELDLIAILVVFAASLYLGISGSILLIQNGIERSLLQKKLQHVSTQYLDENRKLSQFISSSPFGCIITDQHGIVMDANDTFFEYNPNYVRSEIIGASYKELVEKHGIRYEDSLIYKALQGQVLPPMFTESPPRKYLSSAFPLRSGSDITGAAVLGYDSTELLLLRQQVSHMERLSLVGQMAASITHEIRNPMAVIRGFAQLLASKPELAGHESYFQMMIEELDRANEIINGFLSLAQNRISHKTPHSINSIIHTIVPLLEAEANLNGIILKLKLEDSLPDIPVEDREIKQLLLNLSRNAMEAMEEEGQLTIGTRADEQFIYLSIADTGKGIPEDKLDQLFEPFFTTKDRGTGLGLPVCLSIAKNHGGTIEVTTQEGKGTTFTVSLRRPHSDPHAHPQSAPRAT